MGESMMGRMAVLTRWAGLLLICALPLWVACSRPATVVMPLGPVFTAAQTAGLEPVLTIADRTVYAPELRFWLNYMIRFHQEQRGVQSVADLNAPYNGGTLKQYFLDSATQYICEHRAVELQAQQLNVTLGAAALAQLAAARASSLKVYGSEAEYRRMVETMYVSEPVFDYLSRMDLLGKAVFARLHGAAGEQCDDACVARAVAQEDFIAVKYVFRAAKDAQGRTVPAAQRQQVLTQVLRQLQASAQPSRQFDQLIADYSEDRELSGYPQGRLYAKGSRSAAFEQAARQLQPGDISSVVESDEGSYLILRLPVTPQMVVDPAGNSLRYWVAYQRQYRQQVKDWCAALPVRKQPAYARMLP